MFKENAKALLIISLAPVALGLLVGLIFLIVDSPCKNIVITELPSPDKKYKCIVFTRNCDATTGFGTHVSVESADTEIKNKPGNIFIADTDHGKAPFVPGGGPIVNVTWEDKSTIVIKLNEATRVFKSEDSYQGIYIKYKIIK